MSPHIEAAKVAAERAARELQLATMVPDATDHIQAAQMYVGSVMIHLEQLERNDEL